MIINNFKDCYRPNVSRTYAPVRLTWLSGILYHVIAADFARSIETPFERTEFISLYREVTRFPAVCSTHLFLVPRGNSIRIDHVVHRHHYRFPRPSDKKIIAIIQRNEEATCNIAWMQIRAQVISETMARTRIRFSGFTHSCFQAYRTAIWTQQPLPRLRTTRFKQSTWTRKKISYRIKINKYI